MKMKMKFFMPMEKVPTSTHQEKKLAIRNGKPITYESEDARATREKLMSHLMEHRPETTITGPVRLMVKWCFQSTKAHKNGEWRSTKPDTDNLNKTLKDCMTKLGFWKDDALVVSEIIEKFWADVPGIYIEVEEL